ncbi:NHL domain-containing protein [Chondromyces apiculatus]|uniref:Uncharacterized protein n=1 Tax=Chondromyces apiculatus DSM 436 TaxID=1192034 RepID=A0A017SUX8_9BACT|nr:RHS repeat-associated core domain-containing protein [Chondromyces apiculatus]EYF00808.1 Hypothetical protein CAP_9027 [Chondromyces apiculatus DSM 436]
MPATVCLPQGTAGPPAPLGTPCSDADPCNGDETCNGAGQCIAASPPSFDDADPCTFDACEPGVGITHAACAPLDRTLPTLPASGLAFLLEGPAPIQTGADPAILAPRRAAGLRGRVRAVDGSPLAGVTITLLDHPEHGSTRTFADGAFTMVVQGGGPLVITYQADGYLAAARRVDVPWQGHAHAPDVVLVPLDPEVTALDLDTAPPYAEARGSIITDGDGTRQATVLFPPGTTADLLFPDGTLQSISTLSLRATEYTVGDRGPESMPADLPPTSGYTYAVELSADEALAAGAISVEFNQPLPFYVDNFLDFPAGTVVPMGYYDRARAAWVPSDNGRVVRILDITSGLATLDTDGNGAPDDSATLDLLGITTDEQAKLAELYPPGHSLWRVPVQHFTPWDCNWPYGFPEDACVPLSLTCSVDGDEEPSATAAAGPGSSGNSGAGGNGGASGNSGGGGSGGEGGRDPDRGEPEPMACEEQGSIIDCENQVLGESIPLAGTPFSLQYRSDRVAGHQGRSTLTIPLARGGVPPTVKRIDLVIEIAGRRIEQSFPCPCAPSSETTFVWDGKDVFGRETQGEQPITVRVGYIYEGIYLAPSDFAPAFGGFAGEEISNSRTRQEVTTWKRWEGRLGGLDALALGLGGWTLSAHHVYSPGAGVLYLGDGRRRTGVALGTEIRTVAGNGQIVGPLGDGGPARSAPLDTVSGVAVGPDGSVYLSSSFQQRVRRVAPDGPLWTVTGTGTGGGAGDGGPAAQAQVHVPRGLALGSDGSLYIAEQGGHRVRRVAADGGISTVAGTGQQGFSGDGGPATQARLSGPFSVAAASDGTLFIADTQNHRIRRVGTDGTITTIAGSGTAGDTGDEGPATEARLRGPRGVVVAPDGGLYIVDTQNHRIRHVDRRGRIITVAGTGQAGFSGDDGPAISARLNSPTTALLAPDGTLFVADSTGYRIRRISPDGRIHAFAGTGTYTTQPPPEGARSLTAEIGQAGQLALGPDGALVVAEMLSHQVRRIARTPMPGVALGELALPTEDAREAHVFSGLGRHLRTIDLRTGTPLLTFQYDPAGLLASVQDAEGDVVTISRDAGGAATAVTGPFGQTTTLTRHGDGMLATVTNPASEITTLSYGNGGLLTGLTDALGRAHGFTYDSAGRLLDDTDPAGGSKSITRSTLAQGRAVTVTTALGRSTTYAVQSPGTSEVARAITSAAGLKGTAAPDASGQVVTQLPDGRTMRWTLAPDPIFGMLAPYRKQERVTTPGGRTLTVSRTRTATLLNPVDPSSFTALQETVTLNGKSYTEVYTRATRLTSRTTPMGRSMSVTADAQGRAEEIVVPGVAPVQLTYDVHGRIDSMTQGARSVTHAYAAGGFLASVTDPLDQVDAFVRDAIGRVVEAYRPDGEAVLYGHDLVGNLLSVTPPGRPAHVFGYTPLDQRASYDPPPPASGAPLPTTWSYDVDRQLSVTTLPDGTALSHTRDFAGRLAALGFTGGGGGVGGGVGSAGAISRTHDPATGKLASLNGPTGVTLTFGHDGHLLTDVTWSGVISGALHRVYDNDLRVTHEHVNGGDTVLFGHDLDGLLTSAGPLLLSRHPQNGLLTGITVGNAVETLTRDAFGEITGRTVAVGSAPLMTVTYQRDLLGRVFEKTETLGGVTHVDGYEYDLAGRLRDVLHDGVLVTHYDHDENGNRLARVTATSTATASVDDQDRLLTHGSFTFTYDDRGVLQSRTDTTTGATMLTRYDALGNLREVTLPDGTVVAYVVDPVGRRVGKKVNGALVRGWLYRDTLQPAAEIDAGGAVVARFIYGDRPNVPEVMLKGGTTYRIVSDEVGSVRLVVDAATGAIAQRLDYDEFGRVLLDTNPGFQPFGFAGGLNDPETGLVRFGARDYDAETGRWTAKDPLLFEGGDTNLYAYALGDPVNQFDPRGLRPVADYFCVAGGILLSGGILGEPLVDILALCLPGPPTEDLTGGVCEEVRDVSDSSCDEQYQQCINAGRAECQKVEAGKTKCQRCWERCNAGDSPSSICKRCGF